METQVYKNDTDRTQYYNTSKEEVISDELKSTLGFDTFQTLSVMNIIIEVRPGESLTKVTDSDGNVTGYKRASLKFSR